MRQWDRNIKKRMMKGLTVILYSLSLARSILGNLDWRYIGCFEDNIHRILKLQHDMAAMTNEKCIQACETHGNRYAGTQNANECFCGNDEPKNPAVPESDCNKKCIGDSTQKCGGYWRISVYKYDVSEVSTVRTETFTSRAETYTSKAETYTSRAETYTLRTGTDTSRAETYTSRTETDTSTINVHKTESTGTSLCCCENYAVNRTNQDLNIKLQKLKEKLIIHKNNTSRHRAKRVCATDNRPSATYTGIILGASVLISLTVLIVVSDIVCISSRNDQVHI